MSDKDDKTIGYGDLAEEATEAQKSQEPPGPPVSSAPTEPGFALEDLQEASQDVGRAEGLEERIIEKLEQHDGRIKEDPLIGQVIADRFRIEARVGSGGMGSVYRAEQIGMERRIALKVLKPQYSDNEGVRRRFHLEALAASRLTHPNTIRIYDFGETDDQVLYIAMEFLQGRGLATVIGTDKVLSVKRVIHLMSKVCESLAEAHRNKVVHRDLKPDNIFLSVVEDDPDYIKVLDFGVAKIITETNQGRAGTLTEAGHLFGTPRYMAPEQCRSDLVDGRTDIYALGVIMFQCLTGVLPFSDESPIGIMMWHLQREPPTFLQASPTVKVPESVERIVQRCMKKDPNQRFDTVEDLRSALLAASEDLADEWDSVQRRGADELEGLDLSEAKTALAYPQDEQTQAARPVGVSLGKNRWGLWATVVIALGTTIGAYAYLRTGHIPAPNTPDLSVLTRSVDVLASELPIAVHKIDLSSVPSGASVWHGEKKLGETPMTLRRSSGEEVRLVLKQQGYEEKAIDTDFSSEAQSLTVTMKRLSPKKVAPKTKPPKSTPSAPVKPYRPTRIEDFKTPDR